MTITMEKLLPKVTSTSFNSENDSTENTKCEYATPQLGTRVQKLISLLLPLETKGKLFVAQEFVCNGWCERGLG